jgi:hypothetical protein
MMLAMFVFQARDTMGWAFVERIGTLVGYSGDELGVLLSFQSFVGLIGPLIAAMVGKRFGMSTPVILAILLTGATSLSYVLGEHSKTLYTAGVMTICITLFLRPQLPHWPGGSIGSRGARGGCRRQFPQSRPGSRAGDFRRADFAGWLQPGGLGHRRDGGADLAAGGGAAGQHSP